MSTSTTEQVIASVIRDYGLASYAGAAAAAVDNRGGDTVESALRGFVRSRGGDPLRYHNEIARVAEAVLANEDQTEDRTRDYTAEPDRLEFEDFRANAAQVIREMLSGEHLQESGRGQEYDGDEITALLVLAGLEDEVTPEPIAAEAESVEVPGLTEQIKAAVAEAVAPLFDFARRHGFTG